MKKRIIAVILTVLMIMAVCPMMMAEDEPSQETDAVVISKDVEYDAENDQYMLTLDAYVKGSASTITKIKPADIVLVLDQSASMYAPMGATGGKNNKTLYDPNESGDVNVKQYSEKEFTDLYNADPETFKKNASQLGYYVAQSIPGGKSYCTDKYYTKSDEYPNGHKGTACTDECKTHDWFIIKYVEADNYPWKMYRVPQTANPAFDSKLPIKDGDADNGYVISHEAAIVNDLDGNSGFATVGSMMNRSDFVFYKSQYGALYDAVSSFSEGMINSGVDHRLAVVGFAGEIYTDIYRDGSGIYVNGTYIRYNTKEYTETGSTQQFDTVQKIYNASTLTTNEYKNAFMSVSASNAANIRASINAVKSDYYGTNQDVGLDMANKIFENNPVSSEDRDRIIVLFTDGVPSPLTIPAYGDKDTKADGCKEAIIDQAKIAKDKYGAQIYTIWTSTLASAQSRFMRYTSSDYPNASDMSTPGNQIAEPKYASGIKSGEELLEAFEKVFEDVSSTSQTGLKTETVMRDIVAPSFTLPVELMDGLSDLEESEKIARIKEYIKVYESKYTGNETFAAEGTEGYTPLDNVQIEISTTEDGLYQVDVSGYDYSANYVTDLDSGGYVGAKLVVQIPIDIKPDFLGGDNVFTNGDKSGIYDKDGNLVRPFNVPTVDIPLKSITPETQDGYIYVSEKGVLPHLANIGHFSFKDGAEEVHTTVDGINNAYVDIEYTISDKPFNEGNSLREDAKAIRYTVKAKTSHKNLNHSTDAWNDVEGHEGLVKTGTFIEDTPYYVQIRVYPITEDDANEDDNVDVTETVKNKNAQIYVFKPHITFKDSEIDLGEKADDYDDTNYVGVEWKHEGNAPTEYEAERLGTAPNLSYTYNPEEDDFTSDTKVKVTKINATKANGDDAYDHIVDEEMELLPYATFYREKCDFDTCDNKGEGDPVLVNKEAVDWCNFIVHIKTFSLKIVKEGNITDHEYPGGDESQSFIFEVKKGDDHLMNVVINGTGETTITNLPVGEYTVTELENWSWRYKADDGSHNFNTADDLKVGCVVRDGNVITVTFTNTRQNHLWLSGDSFAKNLWGSGTTGIVVNTAETTN